MEYAPVAVSSALNELRRRDPWYGCAYTLNPYRGCELACPYCYGWAERWRAPYQRRALRGSVGLDAFISGSEGAGGQRAAGPAIFIKTNMPSLLRRELRRKARDVVMVGSITDPYQPCEERFGLTRRCLGILLEHGWPVQVATKSTLILRDLELLRALSEKASCSIFITITTLDEGLARLLEPRAPGPGERLEVVEELSEEGLEVCVCMIPVFPGLTDDEGAIRDVAGAAREHGARRFLTGLLTLPGEVRERFLAVIKAQFPELLPLYERLYGPSGYPDRAYEARVMATARAIRSELGLLGELSQPWGPQHS
ncbi:MAG TPA: radical SAM protein [Candidatus Bathyarchaeota archaeon]|nr:radical SAM protein [Candidatus Bathyarchaeota archaeon]